MSDEKLTKRERDTRYMRRRRQSDSLFREHQKKMVLARSRALTRLGDIHSEELAELINDERAKDGLPPLGETPLGRPPGSKWQP